MASSGYIEMVLTSNCGGGAPGVFYFNNAVLSGVVVPEPASAALGGLRALGLLVISRRRNR